MNEIGFRYGAMCDELEKQANEQGYTIGEFGERAEKIRKSILTLIFAGILPNSESDKCFKRLQKQIVKKLKPID